jgi:hypothetical protein
MCADAIVRQTSLTSNEESFNMKEKIQKLEKNITDLKNQLLKTEQELLQSELTLLENHIKLQDAIFNVSLDQLKTNNHRQKNVDNFTKEATKLIADFSSRNIIETAFQTVPAIAHDKINQMEQTYKIAFKEASEKIIANLNKPSDDKKQESAALTEKAKTFNLHCLESRTNYNALINKLENTQSDLTENTKQLLQLQKRYQGSLYSVLDSKNINQIQQTFSTLNYAKDPLPDTTDLYPLHYLCAQLTEEDAHIKDLVSVLFFCGADHKKTDQAGNTPLHISSIQGLIPATEFFLLQKNTNTELTNNAGYTPLHLAIIHQRVKLVEYLLALPATDRYPIFQLSSQGKTPFELALLSGNFDLIKLFFTHHALQTAKDVPYQSQLSNWISCINKGTPNQLKRHQIIGLLKQYLDSQERRQLLPLCASLVNKYYSILTLVRPQLPPQNEIMKEKSQLGEAAVDAVLQTLRL